MERAEDGDNGDMERKGAGPARGSGRTRTIRALVLGHVQGVGFRWSCLRLAESLGLVGEVRNTRDGAVEVLAQGPADDVARLIVWLYQGPRWSEVEDVRVEDLAPGALRLKDFRVVG